MKVSSLMRARSRCRFNVVIHTTLSGGGYEGIAAQKMGELCADTPMLYTSCCAASHHGTLTSSPVHPFTKPAVPDAHLGRWSLLTVGRVSSPHLSKETSIDIIT